MRAVNLLPRDEQRARLEGARTPLLLAAAGVAAVTAGAVMLALSASGTADDRRAELAAVEAAIARLPKAQKSVLTQGVLLQERTDRTAALSAALSTRVSFDRVLREISYVLPEDTWLTGFEATGPATFAPATTSTPGTPTPPVSSALEGVTIEGATYSHESVARVLSRLSAIPSLENVRLAATARVEPQAPEVQLGEGQASKPKATKKKKKGKAVVTFTVSATLRTGASS
jgi:Tfp pilus assembly protein PilN